MSGEFPGFGLLLVRSVVADTRIELRLFSGFYPAEPGVDPVVYVTVEGISNLEVAVQSLTRIEPFETVVYPSAPSETQLRLDVDHEEAVILNGAKVIVRSTAFEAEDYEYFTKQQALQIESLNEALRSTNAKLTSAASLLAEQERRTAIKADAHKQGGTARTLYEQQLHLIRRVRSAIGT